MQAVGPVALELPAKRVANELETPSSRQARLTLPSSCARPKRSRRNDRFPRSLFADENIRENRLVDPPSHPLTGVYTFEDAERARPSLLPPSCRRSACAQACLPPIASRRNPAAAGRPHPSSGDSAPRVRRASRRRPPDADDRGSEPPSSARSRRAGLLPGARSHRPPPCPHRALWPGSEGAPPGSWCRRSRSRSAGRRLGCRQRTPRRWQCRCRRRSAPRATRGSRGSPGLPRRPPAPCPEADSGRQRRHHAVPVELDDRAPAACHHLRNEPGVAVQGREHVLEEYCSAIPE